MRILVTAGATREPIDSIRYISNFSTGRTGAMLSQYLAERGHEVTHLAGKGSYEPNLTTNITLRSFETFSSLESLLFSELNVKRYDLIIHAAAVGDFSLAQPFTGKLESNQDLQLDLKPNPKLILKIRSMIPANYPQPVLVGFKLTSTQVPQERQDAILKLSMTAEVDFVVHNDFSEIQDRDHHPFYIYQGDKSVATCIGTHQLADQLLLLMRRKYEL
jgi:phosphopantothenoylcysteine decarboxylase/phosphopantothenate--cysteine ligase